MTDYAVNWIILPRFLSCSPGINLTWPILATVQKFARSGQVKFMPGEQRKDHVRLMVSFFVHSADGRSVERGNRARR